MISNRADPRETAKRLFEIASRQGGYFTAKQAFEAGYYYRLQNYHKAEGNWEVIERGIYRLPNFPNSPHEDLIRWSLWSCNRKSEPQAVISHQTAASVYELGDLMPAKTHLTVPKNFRKEATGGCVIHKADFAPQEKEWNQGFFITTPLRTIVDLAEIPIEGDQLNKVVDDALRRGMIRREELIQASERSRELKQWLLEFRVAHHG